MASRFFVLLCTLLIFLLGSHATKRIDYGRIEQALHGNMVLIPSGKFKLFFKEKDEKPANINAFYLDVYPVTNLEFLAFVKANSKWRKSKIPRLYSDVNYLKHWESDLVIGKNSEKIINSPVTNVSWFAANAYCKWKGKRMPTVLEWEYAASADIENRKNIDDNLLKIILDWYTQPTPKILPPVGSVFKNSFGAFDMHGLIWEWTYDFNSFVTGGDSRSSSAVDRNLFCGSAGSIPSANKEDYAAYMRYGYRGSLKGNYTVSNLGFRCAMNE